MKVCHLCKLICQPDSFMDSDKRQEIPRPQIKDFSTESNISTGNIGVSGAFLKPQMPQGNVRGAMEHQHLQQVALQERNPNFREHTSFIMGSKDACLLFQRDTCFPSSKTLHLTTILGKLSRTAVITVSAHKIGRNVRDPQTIVSQQYPGQCLVEELRLFFIQKHRLRRTDLSSCN